MSTNKATVDRILTQLAPLQVRARAMFGEYGLYCDEKIVVLLCDDRCFLKPSPAASAAGFELESQPPYPGAKPYLVIDDRLLLDRTRLRELVQATADALPAPKPRRSTKKARKGKK